MNVSELIQKITPLYNKYKTQNTILTATEAIEIMWDIGECFKDFFSKNDIAPHNLYRKIYGKSEGSENITQQSYITREFQSRCYRIRNIFDSKKEISEKLPNLKNFILFREAMPFFDNKKYKFDHKDMNELLKLLNSKQSPSVTLKIIRSIQKEKIGVKNPRTQRLNDLEEDKHIFIKFYNYAYDLVKNRDYQYVLKEIPDAKYLEILIKDTSALSQEGLKSFPFDIPDSALEVWINYGNLLKRLLADKNAKERRRFRRLIQPERIVRLSDMLFAFTSEEKHKVFK